jgi:hypothetical protein
MTKQQAAEGSQLAREVKASVDGILRNLKQGSYPSPADVEQARGSLEALIALAEGEQQ